MGSGIGAAAGVAHRAIGASDVGRAGACTPAPDNFSGSAESGGYAAPAARELRCYGLLRSDASALMRPTSPSATRTWGLQARFWCRKRVAAFVSLAFSSTSAHQRCSAAFQPGVLPSPVPISVSQRSTLAQHDPTAHPRRSSSSSSRIVSACSRPSTTAMSLPSTSRIL
jgi:hypothetical protein